jgi:hypothetical protein
LRHFEFQHHDCDDNGEHAVAERFERFKEFRDAFGSPKELDGELLKYVLRLK